ncbi:MAG TPA: hypothetical protein VKV04_14115 [Verrucomicrobiae bacterium]|nr:hypothetical protein [Verrucomicrobiae bacterium]
MSTDKNTFTAAQIADALGIAPDSVRKALGSVPPQGEKFIRGKKVSAWGILQLPQAWIAQLDAHAAAKGLGNAEQLIAGSHEQAAKPNPSQVVSVALAEIQDQFPAISDYIAACGNPAAPDETEQLGIWMLAFEQYERLVSQGETEKQSARRVRDFLSRKALFLAPSRHALRMAFERKLERWNAGERNPTALQDRRKDNGAGFDFPEEDRDKLIHRAVFNYHGVVASAWRDLMADGFSEAVRTRYAGKAFRKSHVPGSVMDDVGPEVDILTVMHQGPRAFDAIKGYVSRSYDGISSLQAMSADDFTLNSYFYVPDGKGWFTLTRGQTILFIDFRSLRILGYALEPRRSYSSLTIRSLCTHVFAEFGLPEVLQFERGLWKSATLLKGKKDPFTFAQVSSGLAGFGIRFIHSIRPRSKVVERIGGMFQSLAEAEPGYCGRDERHDAPESLRKEMAEVETRKVHPSKYFYDFTQWNQRIGEIAALYNSTPQQGKILAGMSPDEAFKLFLNRADPPNRLDAGLRYLLAHEKRVVRVTLNGITIQIGKRSFNYKGKEIAHMVHRDALAWFDPDNPEVLTVTGLDKSNPICVSRSEDPSALQCVVAPGADVLGREMARIDGQASYMKTRFNVLKTKFELPARKVRESAPAFALGREIEKAKSSLTAANIERQSRREKTARAARSIGLNPAAVQGDPAAIENLSKLLRDE